MFILRFILQVLGALFALAIIGSAIGHWLDNRDS
jgi:hypothetical protein